MTVLPYEVKRAHWRVTWDAIMKFRARADAIREPILWDMTPARFDFLYVVWRADAHVHDKRKELGLPAIPRVINMSELRELLGLSGATISRMAYRLEELEYVRLVAHPHDGRAVVIVLTELGEKLLRLAVECIRLPGVGMVDRIARFVELDGETFAGLAASPHDFVQQTAELVSLRSEVQRQRCLHRQRLDRLAVLTDRWRSFARFFGCNAVPIYDTRLVTYLRPHTVSLRVWSIPGADARERILLLNRALRATEQADREMAQAARRA